MIDIDYFKYYNDTKGHQAGDDCLIQVAQAISSVVQRQTDLVSRYGGEEFAVILPHTNLEGALKIAADIAQAVVNLQIPHQASAVSDRITLSVGVTSLVPPWDDKQSNAKQNVELILWQADQALYGAKHQGRNRIVSYSPDLV
jgi:diguanylate cyclase (GGDEF)-like protein